jgi:hypothetical protein
MNRRAPLAFIDDMAAAKQRRVPEYRPGSAGAAA